MGYDRDEYESYGPEHDREVTIETAVSVQWSNDTVIQGVIKKLSDRIYDDIKPKVKQAVLKGIDDQVNAAIAAVLDREIQPTDRWGDSTGPAISIRAMLQRDAEQWLTENVDSSGRTGRDSYGQRHSRAHWIFQEALNGKKDQRGKTELQKLVIKTAKDAIGDVTKVVEAEVREQARAAHAADEQIYIRQPAHVLSSRNRGGISTGMLKRQNILQLHQARKIQDTGKRLI